jgi:hypothetical protein
MNRCQYCGKEYADNVTTCPIDGQLVVGVEGIRNRVASRPTFNAQLVSPLLSFGLYRIYVRRSDLIFVWIEGGVGSILEGMIPFLGHFAALVLLVIWSFSKRTAQESDQKLDANDPENLLRGNAKNFRLSLSEIRDAAMEPASFWGFSNGQAGRLNFSVRHGEKVKLVFETPNELEAALQLLSPLMPSLMQVNVEWNESKHRFQKKNGKTS